MVSADQLSSVLLLPEPVWVDLLSSAHLSSAHLSSVRLSSAHLALPLPSLARLSTASAVRSEGRVWALDVITHAAPMPYVYFHGTADPTVPFLGPVPGPDGEPGPGAAERHRQPDRRGDRPVPASRARCHPCRRAPAARPARRSESRSIDCRARPRARRARRADARRGCRCTLLRP